MSVLIDQEAWLAYYAEILDVEVAQLSERDLRLALATYHGIYLPTAATVELRANELDLRERYAEFGFTPNTPSFATGKVKVTLPNAATTTYNLGAPFVVRQDDLTFIATTPLTIPAGQTTGEANIVAQLQGEAGTPEEAAANITVSVAWLRGAATVITDVSPGRDGGTTDEITAEFRAYAFNPQALVRAEDHAAYIETTFSSMGRALAHPRTRITYDNGAYSATAPIEGHLSIALISSTGSVPTAEDIAAVKDDLLRVSVPYGADALHVVPASPKQVSGAVVAVIEPGVDQDETKSLIVEALDNFLDWRTWPAERDVHAGDMWRVVDSVANVRYVNNILFLSGDPRVATLEPWQYPQSAFSAGNITLTEAS